MPVSVTRRYNFESAHYLPNVADNHRCKRVHGHNYVVDITIGGKPDPHTGFVLDFWDMDKIVQPIIDEIDHRTLNDIAGLDNPTAELIAIWFRKKIGIQFFVKHQAIIENIRVYETPNCWSDYRVD